MAWNDDPKVRKLGEFAQEHEWPIAIVFALTATGEKFEIITYGKTRKLCEMAKAAGENLDGLIQAGSFPDWSV